MNIDSATAANVSTLASINPSTALIVLVLGLGIIYLLSLLLKSTALTQAIADRMDGDDTADVVREIRADQLRSNEERRNHGLQIVAIQGRLDHLERVVGRMEKKCDGDGKFKAEPEMKTDSTL